MYNNSKEEKHNNTEYCSVSFRDLMNKRLRKLIMQFNITYFMILYFTFKNKIAIKKIQSLVDS